MSNRRTGKIASLSFELRTEFNGKLRDGVKSAVLIKWLQAHDVFGVNEQNITNWFQGGYADWLKEQSRLADMQAKREFAMEIVKQNQGSQLHEATLHLAASQLYEALTDFDISKLKTLLDESPQNYTAVVDSLAKLSKGALDLQKYKDAMSKAKVEIQKLLDPNRKFNDAETLAVVNRVDEILGLK